jgi:hypothetical protein
VRRCEEAVHGLLIAGDVLVVLVVLVVPAGPGRFASSVPLNFSYSAVRAA